MYKYKMITKEGIIVGEEISNRSLWEVAKALEYSYDGDVVEIKKMLPIEEFAYNLFINKEIRGGKSYARA